MKMFVCLLYSFWFMPFLFYFFNVDLEHFLSRGFFLPLFLCPFGWLVKLTSNFTALGLLFKILFYLLPIEEKVLIIVVIYIMQVE